MEEIQEISVIGEQSAQVKGEMSVQSTDSGILDLQRFWFVTASVHMESSAHLLWSL